MKTKPFQPLVLLILIAGFLVPSFSGYSQMTDQTPEELRKEVLADGDYLRLRAKFTAPQTLTDQVENELFRLSTSSPKEQAQIWNYYLSKLLASEQLPKNSPILQIKGLQLKDDPESIQRARQQLTQIHLQLKKQRKRTPLENAFLSALSSSSDSKEADKEDDKEEEDDEEIGEEGEEEYYDEVWEDVGGALGTLIGWVIGAVDDEDNLDPDEGAKEGGKLGKAIGKWLGKLFGKKKKKKKKKKK
ncbi:MAG: hypothetical protein AAFV80_08365 [Bacteroidota bacterium]